MLELFFKEQSTVLKYVKIVLLILMVFNGIVTIGIMFAITMNQKLTYDYLGIKQPEQVNSQEEKMQDAVYKGIIEEMALLLILEFMGFFSILFNNVYLVLMFASAYLMPNIRFALNLGFAVQIKVIFFTFHLIKTICALESYHFACLTKQESKARTGDSTISSVGAPPSNANNTVASNTNSTAL